MRVRRHVPRSGHRDPAREPATPESGRPVRRWLRDGLVVLATFGVGYLIASVWLSPVPLFSADHVVPRLLDLSATRAEARLAELGFRGRVGRARTHPTIPVGHVAWQDPPAGMVLAEHTVIAYAPSSGPAPIPVPDVIGFSQSHAERVIAAAGLRAGSVDTVSADPEPGVVIATRPAIGTAREAGGTVDLVVSGRPLPVPALQLVPLGARESGP